MYVCNYVTNAGRYTLRSPGLFQICGVIRCSLICASEKAILLLRLLSGLA